VLAVVLTLALVALWSRYARTWGRSRRAGLRGLDSNNGRYAVEDILKGIEEGSNSSGGDVRAFLARFDERLGAQHFSNRTNQIGSGKYEHPDEEVYNSKPSARQALLDQNNRFTHAEFGSDVLQYLVGICDDNEDGEGRSHGSTLHAKQSSSAASEGSRALRTMVPVPEDDEDYEPRANAESRLDQGSAENPFRSDTAWAGEKVRH
jgi:hypothetical protein